MTKKATRASRRRALTWSPRAVADLEAIGEYISRDDPTKAESWLSMLVSAAQQAALLPLSGRRVPEFGREEIREVIKKHYRIVYRITKTQIQVLTVFESHRQLKIEF